MFAQYFPVFRCFFSFEPAKLVVVFVFQFVDQWLRVIEFKKAELVDGALVET